MLNDKQKRFCEEYLVDLNATQAAMRSGYSKNTAKQIGSENLSKPDIQAYISQLQEERSKRTLIEADFVILGLKEVAERCMTNKPVMEWNHMDKCLQHKEDADGKGVYEFDSSGANRSLELLGKHLGLFEKDNKQKSTVVQITGMEIK
ncbi:MAG TPA: terminase small subunit [Flavisolibacter sp.]|nr:terminase small subunit [Flavisolibacter sp.]